MYYYPGDHWYALRVKYQYESIVEKTLKHKSLDPLHLTYRILSKRKGRKKMVRKPFFPGYVFVKSELTPEIHLEILRSTGVIELLKDGQGPHPIPENQICNVLRLKDYDGKMIIFNDFRIGLPVRIIQGPLKGVEGYVDSIKRDLIIVGIETIPGSVSIQISPDQIEPIDSDYSINDFLN